MLCDALAKLLMDRRNRLEKLLNPYNPAKPLFQDVFKSIEVTLNEIRELRDAYKKHYKHNPVNRKPGEMEEWNQ